MIPLEFPGCEICQALDEDGRFDRWAINAYHRGNTEVPHYGEMLDVVIEVNKRINHEQDN